MFDDLAFSDYVPQAVCVNHMKFVPCRGEGPCAITSEPAKVEAVRKYQSEGE